MRTLALELSTDRGSIALVGEGEEVFTRVFENDRKHSGLFFESLQLCLQNCGAPDMIVVGLGPGSYAGTRIAIAAAIGLHAASRAQLIGIPSICAFHTGEDEYVAIGDARRESFYFARVVQSQAVEGPMLLTETELRERLSKSAIPIYASSQLLAFPEAIVAHPSALSLAEIAREHPQWYRSSETLEPIYLRAPHITIPKFHPGLTVV